MICSQIVFFYLLLKNLMYFQYVVEILESVRMWYGSCLVTNTDVYIPYRVAAYADIYDPCRSEEKQAR